jgi:hypothetical protein
VFQTHVSSVSSVFFYMLQVLHLDVSKVDRYVAHVTMVFQLHVPNISYILDVCCKIFYLDVAKVYWDVERRGRWLLLLPRHSRGSTHVDFPIRGASPCYEHEVRCWGGTWDADTGAAQVSEPHLDATSHPDARHSAHVYIAAKIHLGTEINLTYYSSGCHCPQYIRLNKTLNFVKHVFFKHNVYFCAQIP